jgi:hypothetical protein
VDIWDGSGDSIVEHVAGIDDFEVAEATPRDSLLPFCYPIRRHGVERAGTAARPEARFSPKTLTKWHAIERAGMAEAELPNRCSTTELTRQINDLAILHSTNWHRIGTGRLGQDCSYQLRRQAINDHRT